MYFSAGGRLAGCEFVIIVVFAFMDLPAHATAAM
jgi:hypothetical protein